MPRKTKPATPGSSVPSPFKFLLGEIGQVIGSARYLHSNPQHLIRYRAADGRAVEAWWDESALVDARGAA